MARTRNKKSHKAWRYKMKAKITQDEAGRMYGWRSGLEEAIAEELTELGVPFDFETHKIKFEQPVKKRTYTPDFVIKNRTTGEMTYIETKGRFMVKDRMKHKYVKWNYPDIDIRFVFNNAHARISKASKTTYAQWCEKEGFKWAHQNIPMDWVKEFNGG